MGALTGKMEQAAAEVVAALVFTNTYTINTGLDTDRLPTPNIVCAALDTGDEIPLQSGNHIIKLRITLSSNPKDLASVAVHNADFGVLDDAFRADDIGATLGIQQVGEFSAYDPPRNVFMGEETDGHNIKSWIELDMLCCSSDIT